MKYLFKNVDEALSFYEKKDECHLWKGLLQSGYGIFRVKNDQFRIHRVAYENSIGEIPEGLNIVHTCGSKNCINPSHLYASTDRNREKKTLKESHNQNTIQICFCVPEKLKIDLKIMCALTNRNISEFIRISIQDKIKQLKERVS